MKNELLFAIAAGLVTGFVGVGLAYLITLIAKQF